MKKIISIALSVILIGWSLGISNVVEATVLPIAGSTYNLAGNGVSSTGNSVTLSSFTIKQTGQIIRDSDMSDTFYLTIEPGNPTRQEIVSCTTVTQNANNTATLGNCSRGLSPITPYTASTTLRLPHAGGVPVIFSDAPQLFNSYPAKENNEVITGYWGVPDPINLTDIANKEYVLSVVSGGSFTTNKIIVTGTAGETLVAGNLVYLNTADSRWYKVNANSTSNVIDTLNGISEGAGTSGSSIVTGVLLLGTDSNQTGLVAGKNYFASTTAGALGIATTTLGVGKAQTATSLYFSPRFANIPQFSSNQTWTGINTFTATSTQATTTINGEFPFSLTSLPTYVTNGNSATTSNLYGRDFMHVTIFASTTNSAPALCLIFNSDFGNNYTTSNSFTPAGDCTGAGTQHGIRLNDGQAGEIIMANLDISGASGTPKIITGTLSNFREDRTTLITATTSTVYMNFSNLNAPITSMTMFDSGGTNSRIQPASYIRVYSDTY